MRKTCGHSTAIYAGVKVASELAHTENGNRETEEEQPSTPENEIEGDEADEWTSSQKSLSVTQIVTQTETQTQTQPMKTSRKRGRQTSQWRTLILGPAIIQWIPK